MKWNAIRAGGRHRSTITLMIAGMLIATSIETTARGDEIPTVPTARNQEDDDARQIAQNVFSGEEYWWKRTSDVKSTSLIGQSFSYIYEYLIAPIFKILADLIQWLLDQLCSRLKLPRGDWSKGIPFLWTIIALIVLITVWRMVVLFRRRSNVRVEKMVQASADILPQADLLLEQARAALAQGDRRSAIRLAFLSLLAWFQDRGQLKYDRSRSNREYQNDLRRWPESVVSFKAAAEPFERCWYGGRDLNSDQVQKVITLCGTQIQRAKGKE